MVAQGLANVVKAFGQKAAGTAAGVVDGLADFWVNGFDHGANHHPWGKELAAVVALFAHFEQQPFVHLGEGKDMGGVNVLLADGVNFVENVEEVLFGIDAGAFDAGEYFANHFLPGGSTGKVFESFEVGNQVGMEELKELALGSVGEFLAFPALGEAIDVLERVGVVGGGPFAPAVGKAQGGGKGLPHGFEFVLFAGFEFVENAEEQDPGEFGDVLKGTGTVGATHDVADGFDVAI